MIFLLEKFFCNKISKINYIFLICINLSYFSKVIYCHFLNIMIVKKQGKGVLCRVVLIFFMPCNYGICTNVSYLGKVYTMQILEYISTENNRLKYTNTCTEVLCICTYGMGMHKCELFG